MSRACLYIYIYIYIYIAPGTQTVCAAALILLCSKSSIRGSQSQPCAAPRPSKRSGDSALPRVSQRSQWLQRLQPLRKRGSSPLPPQLRASARVPLLTATLGLIFHSVLPKQPRRDPYRGWWGRTYSGSSRASNRAEVSFRTIGDG